MLAYCCGLIEDDQRYFRKYIVSPISSGLGIDKV